MVCITCQCHYFSCSNHVGTILVESDCAVCALDNCGNLNLRSRINSGSTSLCPKICIDRYDRSNHTAFITVVVQSLPQDPSDHAHVSSRCKNIFTERYFFVNRCCGSSHLCHIICQDSFRIPRNARILKISVPT